MPRWSGVNPALEMAGGIHLWSSGLEQTGGIQQYSRQVLAVLNHWPQAQPLRHFALQDRVVNDPARDRVFGRWPPLLRRYAYVCAAWASALWHRPRLILATHPHFLPALLPLKLLGIRVVCSAHGIETWSRVQGSAALPFARADGLLPVSTHTAAVLALCRDVQSRQIEVVANTYDETQFAPGPPKEGLRIRLGIAPSARVVFTLGRMAASEAYKGHELVMQAIHRLRSSCPDLYYLVGGDGDDLPRLRALAAQLGLEKRVIFAGRIAVQELADHYRLSDVFAMPSTGEGFGIAFLEAMACGVPCVAGNADGSRDALDHGRLGFLVDPRDPAAVAKGIESALAVGKDRVLEPEGRRLHEEVRRCFGNDVFAQRLRLALQSFGNLEGR